MNHTQPLREWALENGSGTLKNAIQLDMRWKEMALHERLAMTIATSAVLVPSSRLTHGPLLAEPDAKVTTEMGWYARTLRMRWGDSKALEGLDTRLQVVYFTWDDDGPCLKEGAGFLVPNLELPWFPSGRSLLIPVSSFNRATKQWAQPENPL